MGCKEGENAYLSDRGNGNGWERNGEVAVYWK